MSAEKRVLRILWPVWAFCGGTILLAAGQYLWPYFSGGVFPPLSALFTVTFFVAVLGGCAFAISHGPFRAMVLDERRTSGDCLHCGYPLKGNSCIQNCCPECGKEAVQEEEEK